MKQEINDESDETECPEVAEIEDPETTADIIGLSAVVVQDLSAKRIKDYSFEWERVCSFEVFLIKLINHFVNY